MDSRVIQAVIVGCAAILSITNLRAATSLPEVMTGRWYPEQLECGSAHSIAGGFVLSEDGRMYSETGTYSCTIDSLGTYGVVDAKEANVVVGDWHYEKTCVSRVLDGDTAPHRFRGMIRVLSKGGAITLAIDAQETQPTPSQDQVVLFAKRCPAL